MKDKNGEHPFSDTGQLVFLCSFLVIWIMDSFFFHWSTFLSDYAPLYLRLVTLGLSLITALYLFQTSHFIVNHEQHAEKLITNNFFRYVRHPLYLGSMLTYLGLTVFTMSFFSISLLVLIFLFYDYIADYEEKLLEERFGKEYIEYKRRTGKWIPKASMFFNKGTLSLQKET